MLEPRYTDDFDYDDIKPLSCFCKGMCPNHEKSGTCETKPGGKCFASADLEEAEDEKPITVLSYGCLPPNEMAVFQCRAAQIEGRSNNKSIKCCDTFDFCNKHLLAVLDPTPTVKHEIPINKIMFTSITISLVLFIIGIVVSYLKFKKSTLKMKIEKKLESPDLVDLDCFSNSITDNEIYDEESIVGSCPSVLDSAIMGINERTIGKDISLDLRVEKGKYADVWQGKWKGDRVTVKIYKKLAESHWLRDVEIFQMGLMRHDNIVGYIAADIQEKGEMYLITQFHPNGPLRNFLDNHTVTPSEAIEMIKGLSSGLTHMHTEIIGSNYKACITHNNINSKNIQVGAGKKCSFDDFSKAATYSSSNQPQGLTRPKHIYNVDMRYLAPEFLTHTYNPKTVESYIQGDIYSFSLIIWEILSRCVLDPNDLAPSYQIPYAQELEKAELDLGKKNMIEIVVTRNIRPHLRDEWKKHYLLGQVVKIVEECWTGNARARLSCLRIKKSIFKILEDAKEGVKEG
ncbi:bone morphogenetic protein receptor type-1B-like [Euwallacea similis]|uniref:bone morphogenetic protein receptor type-1B-like n=1 Tax=Euwallacea similis TaxID=1736056 RepID=UPI00344E1FDD